MTVTANGGNVAVDAGVTIEDSRNNKSYMWSVIIHGETIGNIVSTVNYDHQIFSVPLREVTKLTFHDVFQLRPGTYHVELRLYEATPNMDPSILNQSHSLIPEILLSNSQEITVNQ
jgi:hypothetical protein